MSEEDPSGSREINHSSRKQRTRLSLQHVQEPHTKDARLTQSQGFGRRQRSKLNPLVLQVHSIPEDEEVSKSFTPPSNQVSIPSKAESKRRNSETRLSNNRLNVTDNSTQTRPDPDYERGSQQRISSSVNSIINPQVQKEQYCCFSKRRIRKRVVIASIIVVLLIIIIMQLLVILLRQ